MKLYPISVPWHPYGGADARKKAKAREYNRIATRVERFINDDMAGRPADCVEQYLSYSIADILGEDSTIVKSVVSGIDGGSNGVTILKGNFERAMLARSQPAK